MTPQPSRPAASGSAAGSTFVAWPAATSVFSANAPMPSAGRSVGAVGSVIFCVALRVAKQYQGRPRRHDRHSPHTARQLRIDEVAGGEPVDARADRLDDARGLVAEQEREVVVDPALPVVQVGVADAARLHLRRAPRPGPGRAPRSSRLPLGAGALAGVNFATDRGLVASELGFAAVAPNSIDAVSNRDFVLDFLAAAATCATHLSRLGAELVLWSSQEFGFCQVVGRLGLGLLDHAAEEEPGRGGAAARQGAARRRAA